MVKVVNVPGNRKQEKETWRLVTTLQHLLFNIFFVDLNSQTQQRPNDFLLKRQCLDLKGASQYPFQNRGQNQCVRPDVNFPSLPVGPGADEYLRLLRSHFTHNTNCCLSHWSKKDRFYWVWEVLVQYEASINVSAPLGNPYKPPLSP